MAEISLDYTAFTFDEIKSGLKDILKNDGVITDHNFEGSNTSTLLNILAYVNALMNNNIAFMANEQFIQTASLRKNIIKHAKSLKYRVNRRISSKAEVIFTFTLENGERLVIPKYTQINPAESDGTTFITTEEISATNNTGTTATYSRRITIKEGTLISYIQEPLLKFTYNNEDAYTIPVINIEDSGIIVTSRKPNGVIVNFEEYKPGTFYNHGNTFLAFTDPDTGYVQINKDISLDYTMNLALNDVVTIDIIQSKGQEGNGYSIFSSINIDEINIDIVIDPASPYTSSYGGYEEESSESIKKYASLYHSSGERAINKNDWISIIARHPLVETAQAWGGEEFSEDLNLTGYTDFEIQDMKKLGNVYFSGYPSTTIVPSEIEPLYFNSDDISTLLAYSKSYAILGLKRNFVQPVYFYFDTYINTYIQVDPKYTVSNIEYKINEVTKTYFTNTSTDYYNRIFKSPELINKLYDIEGVSSIDLKWDTTTEGNTTGHAVYSKVRMELNRNMFHSADVWKNYTILDLPTQIIGKPLDIPYDEWGGLEINAIDEAIPSASMYNIEFESYSGVLDGDPRHSPVYFTVYLNPHAGQVDPFDIANISSPAYISDWKNFVKKVIYVFPSNHAQYPNGRMIIGEYNGRFNQIVFYNKLLSKVYWGSNVAEINTVDIFNSSVVNGETIYDKKFIEFTNKTAGTVNYLDLSYIKAVKENIFLPGNINISSTKLS